MLNRFDNKISLQCLIVGPDYSNIILIQCLLKQSYSDVKAVELGEELKQIIAILVNRMFLSPHPR